MLKVTVGSRQFLLKKVYATSIINFFRRDDDFLALTYEWPSMYVIPASFASVSSVSSFWISRSMAFGLLAVSKRTCLFRAKFGNLISFRPCERQQSRHQKQEFCTFIVRPIPDQRGHSLETIKSTEIEMLHREHKGKLWTWNPLLLDGTLPQNF